MAVLTVYARNATPTFVAASGGGDSFRNDGDTELLIYNASVSSVTVTAAATGRCQHGFLDDLDYVVAPGSLGNFGPLTMSRHNDSSGFVSFSYSATAGVTVAARRLR